MKLRRTLAIFFTSALWAWAQFPDFTPPTPLLGAAMRDDTREVKRLLDGGADPNEGRFLGAPPLLLALMRHNAAMAEAMIAKGADVMATDGFGATTLMWAAYDERANPALVRELLDKGVDPNAKNKAGETALTWAMRAAIHPWWRS